jgi:hypothetical protein
MHVRGNVCYEREDRVEVCRGTMAHVTGQVQGGSLGGLGQGGMKEDLVNVEEPYQPFPTAKG